MNRSDRFISRRTALKTGAGAAMLGAIGAPAIARQALGQSTFNWKRFAGQKIDVLLVKNPRSDLMQAAEKEFTALTGITVESEQIPEQQQRQKAMIEFTSGRPSFDVAHLSMHVQKRQSEKGKWMEDLRPVVADPTMTNPQFDFSDYGKAGLNFCTAADGKLNAIPTFVDYWILYYNKELFEQKGVAYPKTMDEIFTAAQKLNDPAKGIAGFVSRGLKNANVPVWTSWMLGQGMETVSTDGKLLTDTPEAIWAAELYKKLNRDVAPNGAVGFNWNECQTTFSQGRAAMWLDGIGFATPLEDKTKSRIAGKVGYGVVPPGPKAHHSAIFGDGLGIATASKNKGPAWFYIQFITNKANQLNILKNGAGSPARNSAFANPDVVRESIFGKQWFDCVLQSAQVGRPGLPVIIPVTEFRDIFGVALTNMISGADPKAELAKATAAFKPVLEKSEQG
jgi:multiple sugar transport system substrate-binding protein